MFTIICLNNGYKGLSVQSKGEKTKEKIRKAALRLFSTRGYKATTVREIAAAVGIKQSALYNHFENKEAILAALVEHLASSALVHLFDDKSDEESIRSGKALLSGIATKFKLLSFDTQNEALFKLLMQELYKNERIRHIYLESFYHQNVKKLSAYLFGMMQEEIIKAQDPLLLAQEFFAPLFFYQMQVTLLKVDKKSTSSIVTLFEKHVEHFWESVRVEKSETLF